MRLLLACLLAAVGFVALAQTNSFTNNVTVGRTPMFFNESSAMSHSIESPGLMVGVTSGQVTVVWQQSTNLTKWADISTNTCAWNGAQAIWVLRENYPSQNAQDKRP